MRVKPFIHRINNWAGYYRLVFINHDGEIREIYNAIDYKITSDTVEYVLDDNSGHVTHDRLIAVIEE